MYQLPYSAECNMAKILRVSHIYDLFHLTFDESEITAKYEKRVNICHDRLAWQNIVDLMGKCGVNIFYIFNKGHTF